MKPNGMWVAAGAAAVLLASGCTEDLFSPDSTSILGRLLDPDDNGVLGIQVGVVYQTASLSPGLPGAMTAPGAVQAASFGPAYPNPAAPGGGPTVTIPIQADGPTAISVEIRASFGGVPGTVRNLFNGSVTQDTLLVWNGQDNFGTVVPNGRYDLRLGGPGVSPAQEQVLLVNRSPGVMANLGPDGFNATSDSNGEYLVEDLAVGARFTATSSTGSVLGEQFVVNQVVVVFRDLQLQYVDAQTTVPIGPGDQVEITTRLTPVFAGPLLSAETP